MAQHREPGIEGGTHIPEPGLDPLTVMGSALTGQSDNPYMSMTRSEFCATDLAAATPDICV